MKTYLALLVSISFLGVGCKDRYQEGFNAGQVRGLQDGRTDGYNAGDRAGYTAGYNSQFTVGQNAGYADGVAQGYADGQAYYTTHNNYADGFNDGFTFGFADGKTDGYNAGYSSTYTNSYNSAYATGEAQGFNVGYNNGYNYGFNNGNNQGRTDGYYDGYAYTYGSYYNYGYNQGVSAGMNDGYNAGFNDGYYDAYYGLSNASRSSNKSVKLAAMVNQDLVNYSTLKKFDEKSAMNSIGLSHADSGTVDMEKLASMKEQYFLNQMGKQIEAKFGLSFERSMEVAKVAHQFNKLAGSRELTDKDADSFASSIIGHNLKEVEGAMKKSMEGDSSALNSLLEDIATKNETSPENVNKIIRTIFF